MTRGVPPALIGTKMDLSDNPPAADSGIEQLRQAAATIPPRALGVLAFPRFQALSLWGPVEVLGDCAPAIRPLVLTPDGAPVASSQGPRVHPDASLKDAPRLDLLLVPSGNISTVRHDARLLEWLGCRSSDAEIVMAIGSGIDLLAQTGQLDARRAATNDSFFPSTHRADTIDWVEDTDWTTDGRYVTCCGARAAVDMALGVVACLLGKHPSDQLADHL